MHRRLAVALLACLAMVAVPAAQAAILPDEPFTASISFEQRLGEGGALTLMSGALDASIASSTSAFAFLNTTGATLSGIHKACWSPTPLGCATGEVTLRVRDGASFGYRTPKGTGGALVADHALAVFLDIRGMDDLDGLPVSPSLVAPTIGGTFAAGPWPNVAVTAVPTVDTAVAVVALDEASRIDIVVAGKTIHTATGADEPVLLQGAMALASFQAEVVAVPFEATASLRMSPASQEAASAGLDLARLTARLGQLQGDAGETQDVDLGVLEPLLGQMFAGALVSMPTDEAGAQGGEGATTTAAGDATASQVRLVRFQQAQATGGSTVLVSGAGPLVISDGRVAGASSLVGFGYFQLPWWSYVLWAVAIGLFIATLVRKSPKTNERWDRYNLVGVIASVVVGLLVFYLWDLEVRNAFGASILGGGLSGESIFIVAAIEFGLAGLILFAAVTPLRIAISRGLRLGNQGHFMRLSRPIALLAGFFLGVGLLRAYLDLAVRTAFG